MRYAIASFLPDAFIPLLVVCGALALIIGARRIAGATFMLVATMIVAPLIVEPLLDVLPWWVVFLLTIWIGFSLLRGIAALLLGWRAEQHMTGALAAYTVRWFWLAPFRLLRWLFTRGP